jgi:translocation and assembly module TamA
MTMRRAKRLVLVPAFFLWLLALLCLVPVRVQAQPAALTAADSAPVQGGFDVQIQAPPDIQALLQQHMELMRYRALTDIDDGELARLARAAQQDVQALLGTLGLFTASIDIELQQPEAGQPGRRQVVVRVQPGPLTRVQDVSIAFSGAIGQHPQAEARRSAVRDAWSLRAGMPFTQSEWDTAKANVLRQLGAQDFPLARIAESRAEIDPDAQSARLRVTLDSGAAYRLGGLRIDGLQRFDADLVERIARLRPGSAYDRASLLEAQQRLQDSGYFDSVFVTLQTDGDPQSAPVLVTVRETSRNKLVLGIGASTDSGARLSVEHTNHQLPVIGWRSVSRFLVDRDNQQIGTELTSRPDEGLWRWVGSVQLKNDNASDVTVHSQNLRIGRSKNEDRIDRNYYVEYDRARSNDAGTVTRAQSVSASYAWTQRSFDSLPFPTAGYGLGAELGGGVTLGNQREPFLRALVHWLGVWTLPARSGRITARAQGGAVLARDSAVLPSTQLFLTGGDSTVRGYAFHDIGVRSASGQTTAGRFMVNGSAEWQRPILINGRASDWESTVFIDAGSVADSRADLQARVGVGVGARWKSPVGPLQIDLAYGVTPRKLRLHLTVGFTF